MARYIYDGVAKVWFVPSVANLAAPTSGELTAGTVLSNPGTSIFAAMKMMDGFELTQAFKTMTDVASSTDTKIPGRRSLPDASMTFFDDNASTTIKTALAPGTSGFIVIGPQGAGTGKPAEVWPITTGATNRSAVVADGDPATFKVAVAITGTPNQGALLP